MGLEKVIVRQVVKVAKDTGKLETALSLMEDKLKLQGRKAIEKAGFDPSTLPFSIDDLLNGNVEDTEALLKPQAICSVPPLTESQKSEAITNADNTLITLNTIIANKNKIQIALQTIKTPLQTLTTSAAALDNIITTVKVAVKVIKAIPIPTSVPPGVGIPINVLTILSDSLDQLDKLLTYGKGITTVVPLLTKAVLSMIISIINKLNGLDSIIQPVIITLQFVKTVAEVGDQCPNLSQSEIDIVTKAISDDVTASVAASGQDSSLGVNISSEAELVSQLAQNASPGIYYKGFRLTLQNNPDNEYSFPSRRISATRDFAKDPNIQYYSGGIKNGNVLGVVIIYNAPSTEPQGRYSYSSSTQVLFEEVKWNLDLYMQSVSGRPQAPNELNRMPDLGDAANSANSDGSQTAVGTGSDPLPPGWVVNGPVVVQPLNQNTGNQVQGTISINEPVVVTMVTLGGTAQDSFTNSLITFQKGNKPMNSQLSRESYAQRNQSIAAPNTILSETGIWNYTLSIINNLQNTGNQANFAVSAISIGGNAGVGGSGGSAGNDTVILGNNTSSNTQL
tara:strand:+ start:271 stop:1962 length:1692 start_codon:yes stop_codon:yes gene_type:complete